MRALCVLMVALLFFGCKQPVIKSYLKEDNHVAFQTDNGTLAIYPLSDNTARIQFKVGENEGLPQFVFVNDIVVPHFNVTEKGNLIRVVLAKLTVEVNKKSGVVSFIDSTGNVILTEKPGSRTIIPDSIMGEPCFFVEQSFDSPADEALFGLGQFQDGNFNLKGVTRRLTQVNSQIAIPFVYSSNGYGLLWHQYGLTDFNPADNYIALEKQEKPSENDFMAEVTTTAGTQKVAQNQSLYTGKFIVPQTGEYSIFLNLGDMGNRHYVVINGEPVIDQTNMWLPPTAGVLVPLEAGEHDVQVVCKADNEPTLAWKLKENTTTYRSPNAKMLDYVVFAGSADEAIASYRNLTGQVPLLPKWAYGFWQCRERYTSANHLIETVKEFRKREFPMDVIVQDWQYWGSKGWGVPQFDEAHYPNPAAFIKEIHDLNAHFCISIWSNPDKNSALGKEYVARERFIPGTKWLDYFNPETRQEYWNTLKENMFNYGVDSWWMDAVEPENDALKGEMTHIGPGDFYRLIYPLMVSQSVYEGQRATSSEKRVCILTRSAFSGQQRYGVINWSGDVGSSWDEYKRQIVAGLNFTITGLPYWTTDIGGFFRPGRSQYTNQDYHEILTRWYQWGAFNPIFRMHGYMSETEPWKYGQQVEDNMRKMLNLRYQLLPYIYSEAWQVTSNGSTIMRPLVMDFANDNIAVNQPYQYMFGKAFLVAPVTEAGITQRDVYLPKQTGWFDFWTGNYTEGGQTIKTDAPLDKIPLFVKAGSILPMGQVVQHSSQSRNEELDIYIYEGNNGEFTLYEDEGNNYNYENGAFSTIKFSWNDAKKELVIGDCTGNFHGMISQRLFKIFLIKQNKTESTRNNQPNLVIHYKGFKETVKL